MKITSAIKRKMVQLAAFGYSNSCLSNFGSGRLYEGKWKRFCNPGLNCYSCPAARLSCPIGAIQAVGGSAKFQFSFYAFGFLLAFGVLFGRAVCGWFCPFGLLQELIHKLPSPKWKLKSPFLYVKYGILAIFVCILPVVATNYMGMGKPAFCQFICPAGTLEGGIPLLLAHAKLREALGLLFLLKFFILLVTLAGCLFIYRFFCRVLCPLGAFYGLMNKAAFFHIEIDSSHCAHCGKCRQACRMEADPAANPDSSECIRCGSCVASCPHQAISMGFGKKRSYTFRQKNDKI